MDAGLLPSAFPTEVYEHIIDFIPHSKAGDGGVCATRSALCSCALTCRAWLPRSRHLLYQSVTLHVSRDSVRDQDVMGRLTRTLLASSFIAGLLHHLTVYDASMLNNSFSLALPLMFVCTLPNLHTLTIRETILPLAVTSACCVAISKLTAVTALTLYAVVFPDVSVLGRVLAALPGLHDLTLNNVLYATEMHGAERGTVAGPLDVDVSRMPRVRRLSMTVPGASGGEVRTFRGAYYPTLVSDIFNTSHLRERRRSSPPNGPCSSSLRRTSSVWSSTAGMLSLVRRPLSPTYKYNSLHVSSKTKRKPET